MNYASHIINVAVRVIMQAETDFIINLKMSLPVVDIGLAEMSERSFVCLAPALIAPPLAA
eukprot:scaffold85589_cov41-Cyclotella_meneghiniana.AAC.2